MNTPLIINDKNNLSWITGNLSGVVNFHFNHDVSVDKIREKWNRRIKRFNFKNYLVEMTLLNDDDVERFERINTKNKIGFYYKKVNVKNVIFLEDWYDINLRLNNNWYFQALARSTVIGNLNFGRYYDVFKLLNGESDFMRNITYK